MPVLSVIVPVYNSEKYLRRCVNSIRNQSLEDIEIILVDDQSTDCSADICAQFSEEDSRIVFVQSKHGGPIQTRNKGMQVASSEYVAFVDSDDWIESEAYMKMVRYIKDGNDIIKYLMVYDKVDGTKEYYSNKYPVGEYSRKDIENVIFPTMIWDIKENSGGASSSLCDKIYKKEVLIKSFDLAKGLDYHYHEDSTIVLPAYQWVKKLVITDDILYHHCEKEEASNYLLDDSFFDNLYSWYKHLRKNVSYVDNSKQQIEEAYVAAMRPRLRMYGDRPDRVRFIFPFGRVNRGSRVVIWGYGVVGRSYVDQIKKTNYCDIIGIVDSGAVLSERHHIVKPEKIRDMDFDYVVIAIHKLEIQNEIRNILINWGVSDSKIIGRLA